MEYFTSKEQELQIAERHRKRIEQEQDRVRHSLYRQLTRQEIEEEDRIFFVEPDGSVYLGEVRPDTICPIHSMDGGGYYGVDSMFLREVQEFVQHHRQYVVIFHIRRGYSYCAGIYPARMVADQEELMLEDDSENA